MTEQEMDAKVAELVKEALEEDEREGSHFSDGFAFEAFFPEEDPEVVRLAWLEYQQRT
jgi:hypothetical protein